MSADAWPRAMRALTVFATDPGGLGGLTVRARVGPVLTAFQDALRSLPTTQRRIHTEITDEQLYGGPNIAATLASGNLVMDRGIIDDPVTLVVPMAERMTGFLGARLSQLLDAETGHALVLFDEGADPEETVPACLQDRLAFHLNLTDIGRLETSRHGLNDGAIPDAKKRLGNVGISTDHLATLTALAARFGIESLRAPLLALRAARAIAALSGRDEVSENELMQAAELVFPSRAIHLPEPPAETNQTEQNEQPPKEGTGDAEQLDEILVAAVAALLPPGLLSSLDAKKRTRVTRGSGAGALQKGNRRGRPLAPRRGRLTGNARIDIVATLRAAAPWQPLRRQSGNQHRIIIHRDDICIRRTESRSDRLIVFCVDASGSSAVARLAEAKGAVELLLAHAYADRDHVALVSFRGSGAETLLPSTRSLVQAKRRLAALPGGGGTPLASGLQLSVATAEQARHHGLTPVIALLTDGRANVALDGSGGRKAAMDDANAMARWVPAMGLQALVIDTSMRPGPATVELAAALGGTHLSLPRADAAGISNAIAGALDS